MSALDLLVMRRGTDPGAETCAHALRDLLGAPVNSVERGTLWRFEIATEGAAEPAALAPALERAALRAGRYVNGNRDTCTWIAGAPLAPPVPGDGVPVDVWVYDGDGRDPVALAYFRSQAGAAVRDVRRGTRWRLWIRAASPEAAREVASDLAWTRSRAHGLLCNPQAQTAEILPAVPAPCPKETR